MKRSDVHFYLEAYVISDIGLTKKMIDDEEEGLVKSQLYNAHLLAPFYSLYKACAEKYDEGPLEGELTAEEEVQLREALQRPEFELEDEEWSVSYLKALVGIYTFEYVDDIFGTEKRDMFLEEYRRRYPDFEGDITTNDFQLLDIPGYDGTLEELARAVHRMRSDMVEAFYRHSLEEIERQVEENEDKDRLELALHLRHSKNIAALQKEQFARIWEFCKSHVDAE